MQVRSRKPALYHGLLFGVTLGIVEIVLYFLLGSLGFIINILLLLFLAGFAGYRASTRTSKVSTGLVAGLLVGLFSSLIASIPLFIYYLSNIDTIRMELQQQMNTNNLNQGVTLTNSLVIVSVILFMILLVAGAALLGLGFGSIGGAIGKGKAAQPQLPQYPTAMPPYTPQAYVPPPAYKPLSPMQDYTSPEAYMIPQENTHNSPPPESGP